MTPTQPTQPQHAQILDSTYSDVSRHYAEIAKRLAQDALESQGTVGQKEALYRCAISRAYYAAFYHARAYAVAKLKFVIHFNTGKGSHQALFDWVRDHYDFWLEVEEDDAMNNKLYQAKRKREMADYDDPIPFKWDKEKKRKQTIDELFEDAVELVNEILVAMVGDPPDVR